MKRNQVSGWLDDQEKLYVQELAQSQGLTISKLIRQELLRNYNGNHDSFDIKQEPEPETKQETIPDTKPDTEPTEPENELSEEVRETYRDMESFFNGEQDTKPSSFDSVNWDFD